MNKNDTRGTIRNPRLFYALCFFLVLSAVTAGTPSFAASSQAGQAGREDPGVLLFQALRARQQGDALDAERLLRRALESGKLNRESTATARAALDGLYEDWNTLEKMKEAEDYPAQERFLTFQIERHPEVAAAARALRGFARHSMGKNDEAMRDFDAALSMGLDGELEKGVVASRELILDEAAAVEAKAAIPGLEDDKTLDAANRRLLTEARAAYAAAKQDVALDRLKRLLASRPDHKGALLAAATIMAGLGQDTDAAGMYQRLLRLAPDNYPAMLQLGLVRQRQGRTYEAQAALFRALESGTLNDDDAARAREGLTVIYDDWKVLDAMQERGDVPAQERFHTHYIEKNPEGSGVAHALRGFNRHELGREEEALRDFDAALAMGVEGELQAGVLRSKKAIERSRQRLASPAEKYETEGSLSRALREGALSAEDADAARETLDGIYTDWDVLAVMQDRRDAAAQERFHTWHIGRNPDGAGVSYALRGFVRRETGNPDGALEDLNTALRIGVDENLTAAVRESMAQMADERKTGEVPAVAPTEPPVALPAPKLSVVSVDPYPLFNQVEDALRKEAFDRAGTLLARLERLGLGPNENGITTLLRGDLERASGRADKAAALYEKAAGQITEPYRLSSAYAKLARLYAERGDGPKAAAHAERAFALLPDQPWKAMEVAEVYGVLGMREKEAEYYGKTLGMNPDPRTEIYAFMKLAEIAEARKDEEGYLKNARRYVALADQAEPGALSEEEKGLAEFYRADIFTAEGKDAEAFASLERASRLVTERFRLSDIYLGMARYQAKYGDKNLASVYAEQSASLLPDQVWRLSQAVDVFREAGDLARAERAMRAIIDMDPDASIRVHRDIASMYQLARDRDGFLKHNAAYIDVLTERMENTRRDGGKITDEEKIELYAARKRQRQESEYWRFSQYTFYSRTKEDNYFHGMINELATGYWTLPNGMFGKAFVQYNGTLNSHYAGSYYDASTKNQEQWQSSSYWNDTAYGLVGIKLHPLPFQYLYDFSIQAEYLFPINTSHNKDDDWRFTASYGTEAGDEPQPVGNIWDYYKAEINATYSYRDGDVSSTYTFSDGDVTSGLELRYGKTFVTDLDRNFLIIPYLTATANYQGRKRESSDRWNPKIGGALALKKFMIEDKYKTPMANVEVSVNYQRDLRHSRDNSFGINTAIEF